MIPPTIDAELDSAVADLSVGAQRLTALGMPERCVLLDSCASSVAEVAELWVQAACQAKRIALDQAIAGEKILAGPFSVMRYLRVLQRIFQDVDQTGVPRLPAAPRENSLGRLCVSVMPIGHLYDRLIFRGLRCEVWLQDRRFLIWSMLCCSGFHPGLPIILVTASDLNMPLRVCLILTTIPCRGR